MTMTTTNVQFNPEHTRKVLGHILSHPEQHDQSNWFRQNCTTTACVAGWSAVLAGRTMLRESIDSEVSLSSYTSARLDEREAFEGIDAQYDSRLHYTPKPEFALRLAEYKAAKKRYDEIHEQRQQMTAAAYPELPAYPYPTFDDFEAERVLSVPISQAAVLDMGISTRLATYLFDGNRKIDEITIILATLLYTNGDESAAWAVVNGRSGNPATRALDDMEWRLGALERQAARTRESFNALKVTLNQNNSN